MKRISFLLFCFALLVLCGCTSTVAPYSKYVMPLGDYGEGRIYVTANRDLTRVTDSLRDAGFSLVAAPHDADLVLKTSLGSKRGTTGKCGPVSNIRYELWQGSWVIMTIAGRGPIGRCDGNIVDAQTLELKRYLDLSKGPSDTATDDAHDGSS